jgi:starch synthase
LKVVLLTREYPPDVYGGAGVHVEYLSRELAKLVPVEVRRFGKDGASDPALTVRGYRPWDRLAGEGPSISALQVMSVDLAMAAGLDAPSLVHSHTWYVNFAGHLAKLLYGIPHVATTHSLEPLRPWKAEQLGRGGYALSCFFERTGLEGADAVIAVSTAMRADVLRAYPAIDPSKVEVIHNGIDADEYRPDQGTDVLARHGVDPDKPYVLFVGRLTRQKGLTHLLDAAPRFDPSAQVVLCAGAPDTPEFEREVAARVAELARRRRGVVWISKMLPKEEVIQLMSHAAVFVCPSTYEPLGIVNLEAMACGTPVVATATGGIPEVVEDGVTGLLVPFEPTDPWGTPADPGGFAAAIADRVSSLLADPDRRRAFGDAGRRRVVERFTWSSVAQRTLSLYRRVTGEAGP